MPAVTIVLALLLILVGLVGYFATGMVSWTALIPAFFGLAILVTGLVALKEGLRKHAMHVAAALALLGLLGSASRVPGLFTMLAGGEVERPAAAVSSSIMAALCLVFLVLCVKSFVDARRKPKEQPA